MVLAKRSVFLRKFDQMPGDGFGSGQQRHDSLKVLCLILLVGNGAAVTVQVFLRRSPPGGIPFRDDPVDSVRRQKAVFDPLAEAVFVDRIAEVEIGVAVVLTKGRCGHAELIGRFEPGEDFAPVGIVTGAAPVALIHDDEVEEIPRKFSGINPAGARLGQWPGKSRNTFPGPD